MYDTRYLQGVQARRNLAAWLSSKAVFNRKLVPTNRCTTWVNLESHTELRIWVWISLAKCNIFGTLGLDCNRVDRSQNRTCNAELSSIKRKYTVQDYWTSVCGILSNASGKFCEKDNLSFFQTFILDFHKEKSADTELGFYCIRRLIFLVRYYYAAIFPSPLLCGLWKGSVELCHEQSRCISICH